MARIPRKFIKNPEAAYHIISRTALPGHNVLGPAEKDHLLHLFRWLSKVFFVEVYGFCIMGNHFHLLCRMLPPDSFSDEEVIERVKLYYGDRRKIMLTPDRIPYFRKRFSDLSRFVQEIKQRFSRWYNKIHDRKGYFWSDRFKSVIIEKGEALLNCLAYIDLNPVRAGIVEKPEHYRWCSLGYHLGTGNADGFLSTNLGVAEFTSKGYRERLGMYREFVYGKGGIGDRSEIKEAEVFRRRIRYFSEGLVIGTEKFVKEALAALREKLGLKRRRRKLLSVSSWLSLKAC